MGEEGWTQLPHDFLRDIIIETSRRQKAHPEKQIHRVFRDVLESRKKGFYHQKVEEKVEEKPKVS